MIIFAHVQKVQNPIISLPKSSCNGKLKSPTASSEVKALLQHLEPAWRCEVDLWEMDFSGPHKLTIFPLKQPWQTWVPNAHKK